MLVNMDGVEEPIFYAGPGDYTWKIIEMLDQTNKHGESYIAMTLKNSQNEIYKESFYPNQHIKRIQLMALALKLKTDEGNDLDTHDFVGGYIKAKVDYIIYDSGSKKGMRSERMYLMNIKPSNRRKDETKSPHFTRVKKRKIGIGAKNGQRPNAK